MIIIGEKINSSSKAAKAAIESCDTKMISELARKQVDEGAAYIDINAGTFIKDEPEKIHWLVNTVQEAVDSPLSIDSPKAEVVERALKANRNGKPIINSITGEKDRFNSILPLVTRYDTRVIALCMDDEGMPETVDDRVIIAESLIERLVRESIKLDDIFVDPMVRPVGTGSHYGVVAIETIRKVKQEFPGVHLSCGLSNISFGVPARKLINQAFLVAAMTAGMDTAILDPLDRKLMSLVYATEALLGQDEFCMDYIMKFREGMLEI